MPSQDVYRIWGQPGDVEAAGKNGGAYGNERWTYYEGLSGGLGSARVLYFERGKVVGWETIRR